MTDSPFRPPACRFCDGKRHVSTAYDRHDALCPRCRGLGAEPDAAHIHTSLLLRNVRSGKVWAVYTQYEHDWGIHRMKPNRSRTYYVWQILHRDEADLLDERLWTAAGFGDAWDHAAMESDPLRPKAPQ